MTTMRSIALTVGFAAWIAGMPLASSAADENTLLCSAAEMRKEAQHMVAVAHCQRASTAERALACEERVTRIFENGMARLQLRGICGGSDGPSPSPAMCEAKLMHASATHMDCAGRCGHRASLAAEFDLDGCTASCGQRYENRAAAILATNVCAGIDPAR